MLQHYTTHCPYTHSHLTALYHTVLIPLHIIQHYSTRFPYTLHIIQHYTTHCPYTPSHLTAFYHTVPIPLQILQHYTTQSIYSFISYSIIPHCPYTPSHLTALYHTLSLYPITSYSIILELRDITMIVAIMVWRYTLQNSNNFHNYCYRDTPTRM